MSFNLGSDDRIEEETLLEIYTLLVGMVVISWMTIRTPVIFWARIIPCLLVVVAISESVVPVMECDLDLIPLDHQVDLKKIPLRLLCTHNHHCVDLHPREDPVNRIRIICDHRTI
jgi:hypothetical protein